MADKKETPKIEREYVIPLRARRMHVPRYRKTPKSIKTVKEFLARHMKVYDRDLNKIKLDRYVNEFLWARGIKNPPHKIKVKATKEGDIVKVSLVDMPTKLKFKKAREEKINSEATKKAKPKKEKVEEKSELDKNNNGIKDKVEEKEKKTSLVEAEEAEEKEEHKEAKHETKLDSKKPKHEFRQALEK